MAVGVSLEVQESAAVAQQRNTPHKAVQSKDVKNSRDGNSTASNKTSAKKAATPKKTKNASNCPNEAKNSQCFEARGEDKS